MATAPSKSREAREESESLARIRKYVEACGRLGLHPATRPLTVVRRNNTEVLRATTRATDELAARHRLRREIVQGPRVLVHGTSALAHATCRATREDGRSATASVTIVLSDVETALMVCETRARHVATLRVLDLEAWGDAQRDTIPAGFTEVPALPLAAVTDPIATHPLGEVQLRFVPARDLATATRPFATLDDPSAARGLDAGDASPLDAFVRAVDALSRADDAAPLWLARRAAIAPLAPAERARAWGAICARVSALGVAGEARAWLKQAVEARAKR